MSDHVFAFRPRAIDPPQHVGDSIPDLFDRVGETVHGEQCDHCGNSTYEIRERVIRKATPSQSGRVGFDAVCVTDDPPSDDGFTGCGAVYPIGRYPASEVCF